MENYLCIHSHFYQPPRENPWLEEVEYQESAYPFHDWNERISVECYRPNGQARILDKDNWVFDVQNNYSKISFNFGPTLLSWIKEKDPLTYQKIIEGDHLSQLYFGGHGSAIAQTYNHMILPLANLRDKVTQVLWGLADFKKHFQRLPESMWLAETAVDTPSLEVLAEYGMKYVILAPRQAKAFRVLHSTENWQPVTEEQLDTTQPYLLNLPSGKNMAVFFYNGSVSREVAFNGLLHNGELFANRLHSIYRPDSSTAQLAHIATDGETYGHHHRHGEMALAYALYYLEEQKLAKLTNYGQFLEILPPKLEVQIHENSSWSCVHGIERWRSDCGCHSGQKQEWQQKWRQPLREAFDFIRDTLNPLFEKYASTFVKDPWSARNDYIYVILDRSDINLKKFIETHSLRALSAQEVCELLKLMEIQRHLLLMYTSCGWFFDEISGIETVQNLQYAYRAIDLAKDVLKISLEIPFKEKLALCPSNIPELHDGKIIFEKYVVPTRVDFMRLGAHVAVNSIFENYGAENKIYSYRVLLEDFQSLHSGSVTLAWGYGRIISDITRKDWPMTFGVVHLGDHNINAGVASSFGEINYKKFSQELENEFQRADFPNIIRALDKWFGVPHYSLKDLFKNEQQKIMKAILKISQRHIHDRFNEIYENDSPLIYYMTEVKIPLPKVYIQIAEFIQNYKIKEALPFDKETIDMDTIQKYLDEANRWQVVIDEKGIGRRLEKLFELRLEQLQTAQDPEILRMKIAGILELIHLIPLLPFPFDKAIIQSSFFHWYKSHWKTSNEIFLKDFTCEVAIKAIANDLKIRLTP